MPDYSSCPYEEDRQIILDVKESTFWPNQQLPVQIIRLMEPYTQSVVMEIQPLVPSDVSRRLVLKLFDWRYAINLPDNMLQAQSDQETSENETALVEYANGLHSNEVKAYGLLKDLQGTYIPQFFGDVRYKDVSSPDKHSEIRGILVEFINGYNLRDMVKFAHQSTWARVCEHAIVVINSISDHNMINDDVSPRNIIVRSNASSTQSEVVCIDFAQCRFRSEDDTDESWTHKKWQADEEGALGAEMAYLLEGHFTYEPTYRFLCQCDICINPE